LQLLFLTLLLVSLVGLGLNTYYNKIHVPYLNPKPPIPILVGKDGGPVLGPGGVPVCVGSPNEKGSRVLVTPDGHPIWVLRDSAEPLVLLLGGRRGDVLVDPAGKPLRGAGDKMLLVRGRG
jgi:hypothetical protein